MIEFRVPVGGRRSAKPVQALALVTAFATVAAAWPAAAQSTRQNVGPPIIRDSEIEQLMRDYMQPILRAAGLGKQNIQVVIVNSRTFNAFVADGRRVFVNAGALVDARTPNQIIGVLAHEVGHIAGGHLARMREQLAKASTQSIIALLIGVGAMVAASGSNNSGLGNIGAAAIAAPQEMIRRSLLGYARAQEEQADRAGVKFLNATGQSPRGMYETFKHLADQVLFSASNLDPYLQTHPLPSQRVVALEGLAKSSPHWNKTDSSELQLRHDLMRAKLYGFLDRADAVYRRYPQTDTSLPARYARAIATYRFSDLRNAVAQMDALIQAEPNNPYFHELKGQALLERGQANAAIGPLRRAVQLAPDPTLIRVLLAQALLANNSSANAREATQMLKAAVTRDPEIPMAYTLLAMAYGRSGDYAQADLASAQAALLRGDVKTARELAARAKTRFPIASPGWRRADDIVSIKPDGKL